MFLVCLLTSGTWVTQAYGQAILPNIAPVANGGTTGVRAPAATAANPAMRAITIALGSELTPLLGAANSIQTFGFSPSTAPTGAVAGTVNIYMSNTTDVANTKGFDWTVGTTGMTQVCTNCTFTVASGATSYDITLGTPFAYTGQGVYIAYDFTITTFSPTAIAYLANAGATGYAGTASYQGAAPASNTLGTAYSAFRPEMRFGILNPFTADKVVTKIISPGKMPIGSPSAFNAIKATVLNRGSQNLAAPFNVVLTISGANTFTNTQTIPSLVAGASIDVSFAGFTPTVAGTNTVTVTVTEPTAAPPTTVPNPASNNSLSLALETTCGTFSYANNVAPQTGSGIGFGVGGGVLLNKFKQTATSSVIVNDVRVTISDNAATVGKIINGIVVDAAGAVLFQSADYTVLATDLGTAKSFPIATPIQIPTGAVFFAGLVQTANATAYSPLASQNIASPAGFVPAQGNIAQVETDVLFGSALPSAGMVTPTLQTLNTRLMIDVGTTNIKFTNTVAGVATAGTPYTLNAGAVATSGTITYSVSPALPGGLSINTSTGLISGTPTVGVAVPATNYTVTATTPGACSATQIYNFPVTTTPCTAVTVTSLPSPPVGGFVFTSGSPITPITLGASGGVTGTPTYAYAVTAGVLPAGLTLVAGVISGTPLASGVGTGSFTITATSTPGSCTGTAVYNFTVNLGCTPVVVTPASGALNYVSGTAIAPITVSATGGATGVTYAYAITSGALPAGLTFVPATGIISGTPTVAAIGTGSFTITATATLTAPALTCTGTATYTFTVFPACTPVVVTPLLSALNFVTGVPITPVTLGASGGATGVTYAYTILTGPSAPGALPAGLTLVGATGVISGTPTGAVGTSGSFTVVATTTPPRNCTGTATYTYAIKSDCAVVLAATGLPEGIVGTPYTHTLVATGGVGATYEFTTPTTLPAGLTLNTATGVISGTPTAPASITFLVTAKSPTPSTCFATTGYGLNVRLNSVTAIDNSLANLVKVSPNPSKGDFNVDFSTINMAKSSIRVYDAQGKVVFASENNSNLMTISLDKFANGIYLMEVETSKGRVLKRLAKQ